MMSFERRFLRIKVAKFSSTEAEVLPGSHHHGNYRKYSVNIFYLWFVVCYFRNDFGCSSFINWLIRVQKHIQQEECDVLPLSI